LSRNAFQFWDGGFVLLGIHRDTVRSETSIPSLRSSPWTRGAPHSGFEFAIFRINSRISRSVPGRPGPLEWDRRVQQEAKRFRCHRRTVSGLTMRSVSFQRSQDCDKRIQKRRSSFRSLGRRRWRFKTASCWRRARFSSASSEWVLSAVGIRESSRRIIGIMAGECQAPRHGKSTISMGPEFWRPTGPIQDQEFLLDENGLRDHGADAAGGPSVGQGW